LKLKAPSKVEISNEQLNFIKNTSLVEVKNGVLVKGAPLSKLPVTEPWPYTK